MKVVKSIKVDTVTKKEIFNDYSDDFPCMVNQANLDEYGVLWHWHNAFELFYMQEGEIEYYTTRGQMTFDKGTGGLVNTNVIHSTKPLSKTERNIQLLHIFDSSFIAGGTGNRIDRKYVTPIEKNAQFEIIPIKPVGETEKRILSDIKNSFALREDSFGYEIRLRNLLSEIWLNILQLLPDTDDKVKFDKPNYLLKPMLIYINENYHRKISVKEIAVAGFVSSRECYRIFHNCLHTSPVEYINEYRLQIARQLLCEDNLSITQISVECGFGSSSFFGKLFREKYGCSPSEFQKQM